MVILEDAQVPVENLLGQEGQGSSGVNRSRMKEVGKAEKSRRSRRIWGPLGS